MVFIVRFVRYDDTGVFPRIIKLYRHACYAEISSQFYKSELFVRSVLDFKYIKFLLWILLWNYLWILMFVNDI